MAYTPINWQTGDTITAEKMNKMDNGWSAVQSVQTLFSETVTTSGPPPFAPDDPSSGSLSYSQKITADELVVTFDGNDYTCQKATYEGDNYYGGWDDGYDFTNIPFCIKSTDTGNHLKTETSGTFALSSGLAQQSFETSEGFNGAVRSAVGGAIVHKANGTLDKTWAEISLAATTGYVALISGNDIDGYIISPLTEYGGGSGSYYVIFAYLDGSGSQEFRTSSSSGYPSNS